MGGEPKRRCSSRRASVSSDTVRQMHAQRVTCDEPWFSVSTFPVSARFFGARIFAPTLLREMKLAIHFSSFRVARQSDRR